MILIADTPHLHKLTVFAVPSKHLGKPSFLKWGGPFTPRQLHAASLVVVRTEGGRYEVLKSRATACPTKPMDRMALDALIHTTMDYDAELCREAREAREAPRKAAKKSSK